MITYERYAEIRDRKNLTDGKVAELAGFGRSTFSDWKSGRSIPKYDKMQKIINVLDLNDEEYNEFIGNPGKFSAFNPNKFVPHLFGMMPGETNDFDKELLRLYHNATSDAQKSVMTLLKNSQKEASASSKEA